MVCRGSGSEQSATESGEGATPWMIKANPQGADTLQSLPGWRLLLGHAAGLVVHADVEAIEKIAVSSDHR